jgi:hypothetical protein
VRESTLAIVVAVVVVLALSHESSRTVTVYPMESCTQGCAYITSNGTYKRQQLPLGKETYTAIPERQEVVTQSGSLFRALTQDGYQCAVVDRRNWSCSRGDKGDPMPDEILTMEDGELTYIENPEAPMADKSTRLFYSSYCYSWQVSIHNSRIAGDEPPAVPYKTPNTVVMLLELGVFWLTGCNL